MPRIIGRKEEFVGLTRKFVSLIDKIPLEARAEFSSKAHVSLSMQYGYCAPCSRVLTYSQEKTGLIAIY